MTARLFDVLHAEGQAIAGEPLTPEALLDKLMTDPAFRRRFNGPMPTTVAFEDDATAALAADFENAGRVQ